MPRVALALLLLTSGLAGAATPPAAPAFTSADPRDWIGAPVSWPDLRGKVVLLHVWTFG